MFFIFCATSVVLTFVAVLALVQGITFRVESWTFVTFDCVLCFRWIQAVSDRGACGGGVGGLVELPGTSFRVESWSASSIECNVMLLLNVCSQWSMETVPQPSH